jgi:plastocyanin
MKNQVYKTGRILTLSMLVTLSGLFFGCSGDDDKGEGNNNPGPLYPNEVIIQGLSFSPEVFLVEAGSTVTWRNLDGMTHTVTSDTGIFGSGNIANNRVYSYTFTIPGEYPYHCTLHPEMSGTIIVD